MKKIYEVNIKLLSPLHINAGVAPDSKRLTAGTMGKPYIPGTLFKGMVRDNFELLLNTVDISSDKSDYFFGKEGFNRSRFIFSNLETEQSCITENRINIAVSRYQRNVIDGALVNTEVVSPYDSEGNSLCFKGEITAYYPKEEDIKYETILKKAVTMLQYMGSGKSRGLGFVEVSIFEKG